MSNKELSQAMQNAIKEHGFKRADYTIKVRDAGYDTAVYIKIKNPLVRISEIEDVIKPFEFYERDERTLEILAGGNTFIFCTYQDGIFDDVSAPYLETSRRVFGGDEYDGRTIAKNKNKEIHLVKIAHHTKILYEYDNSNACIPAARVNVSSPEGLAIAMWRFKNLGTISE